MDWTDHLEASQRALGKAHLEATHGGDVDWLATLRWLGKANEHLSNVAIHAAQQALDQGATKKAMALALDVPASTFRGMEKTNAPKKEAKPKAQYIDIATGEWRTR